MRTYSRASESPSRQRLPWALALLVWFQLLGLHPAYSQAFDLALPTGAAVVPSTSSTTAQQNATDAAGNVYVMGYFSGSVQFGSTALTSAGRSDIFVAKLSPTGQWQWAVQGGGTDTDAAIDIAIDASGTLHVAGNFFGSSLQLGSVAVAGSGPITGFVAQLSSTGVWQSAVAVPGLRIYGLAVDASGNAAVTGCFSGTVRLGAYLLTATGSIANDDVFVAKLSAAGTWLWATRAGSGGYDAARGVALDAGRNVYLTGSFQHFAAFGATTLTSLAGDDVFVAKLSPDGAWLWAVKGGGDYVDIGVALTTDAAGSVYVTGVYNSAASMTGGALFGTTLLPASTYGNDVFVARLTTAGVWQWATRAGGTGDEESNSVALDAQGNVYVSGTFSSFVSSFGAFTCTTRGVTDVFMGRLTPGGAWEWALSGGGTDYDGSTGLAIDGQGRAYLVGAFSSPVATFGSQRLPATFSTNGFVVRVTSPTTLGTGTTGAWGAAGSLYPNPATDYATLTLPAAPGARQVQATLYNALGQLVRTQALPLPAGAGTLAFPVAGVPPGSYTLRLQAAGEVAVRRLNIE